MTGETIEPGDLIVMCNYHREYMNNPRTGSAGFLPYVDPGPAPGLVIDTFMFNGRATCKVLWSNGRLSMSESQFLRISRARE